MGLMSTLGHPEDHENQNKVGEARQPTWKQQPSQTSSPDPQASRNTPKTHLPEPRLAATLAHLKALSCPSTEVSTLRTQVANLVQIKRGASKPGPSHQLMTSKT